MERMVILKNMVNSRVGVSNPNLGYNRRWERKDHTQGIPFEIVEQLLWDEGFRHMIDSGILYIENLQDKIDLGLEPAGATEPVNIIVLNSNEIKKLLTETPFEDFKRKIAILSKVQVDNIVDYAIENRLIDSAKCSFLKEVTKKDILLAISRREDLAEEERREQSRGRDEGRRG